ncbi:MAG: cytochrome C oxidase subunit IV family protein [Acidimicrobiales bacterium]
MSDLVHETGEHETGEHGAHPTDAKYVRIALILGVLTAIEVGLYYTSFSDGLTNAVLLALAGTKFVIVAAYFMHLKFDNKLLRRLFTTGFVLASFCYVAYLVTMGVFL